VHDLKEILALDVSWNDAQGIDIGAYNTIESKGKALGIESPE
jgi:hypothetical protein